HGQRSSRLPASIGALPSTDISSSKSPSQLFLRMVSWSLYKHVPKKGCHCVRFYIFLMHSAHRFHTADEYRVRLFHNGHPAVSDAVSSAGSDPDKYHPV